MTPEDIHHRLTKLTDELLDIGKELEDKKEPLSACVYELADVAGEVASDIFWQGRKDKFEDYWK